MPRPINTELILPPGAQTDDTDLAAKLRVVDMDKMRSRGKRWETLGGWLPWHTEGIPSFGPSRGIHAYADNAGNPVVVAGSATGLTAWSVTDTGTATRYVITPLWRDVWLQGGGPGIGPGPSAVSFTPVPNGDPGELRVDWYVYDPATDTSALAKHNLSVGDVVTFSNVVQGSATQSMTIAGTHTITEVPSETRFHVDVGSGTTASVFHPVRVTMAFKAGLDDGVGLTPESQARVWSIDNFGEDAVACASDGTPLFVWQPTPVPTELVVNGTFSADTDWDKTNWTITGGFAFYSGGTAGGDLTQEVAGILEGGKTYEMSFQIQNTGTGVTIFRVLIDDVDIFPPVLQSLSGAASNFNQTHTFRFVSPADPQELIFRADASNTGTASQITVDNVSIREPDEAFPITQAPNKNFALFVDANRICNVLGSVEADGDFDALLLRWCDQDNIREWVPDTDNVAGEFPLGKGSRAVCGAQVGERNLILTDTAAYAASFNNNGYSIRQIGQGCGALGAQDLAVYNNKAFWMGRDSLYAYDGSQVLVIECPIKNQYVNKFAEFQENKTFAWINPQFGEAWFHFAHVDDDNLEVYRYIIFNFVEEGNPFSFGTIDRSCMLEPGVIQWQLGTDTGGNIWKHEYGTNQLNITGEGDHRPFLETGYVQAQGGDQWTGSRRYYPDIEGQVGNVYWTITGKRAPQGQNNTESRGPFLILPGQRTVDYLISGRQIKMRWESQNENETYFRLGVVGLEMQGQRERQ